MQKEIINVDLDTETICCDGSKDSLGDPAEYFTFDSYSLLLTTIVIKSYK